VDDSVGLTLTNKFFHYGHPKDEPRENQPARSPFIMILCFSILLNAIVLLLFVRMDKRLHILEILTYGMLASYMFQNFSALCYMNFKTLLVPEQFKYAFSHFFNRMLLYPLLMVSFLHFLQIVESFWGKVLLFLGSVLVLSGLEWMFNALGVLVHVNWRAWWSLAIWSAALLILAGFMGIFRKLLFKRRLEL
jgi:hypothetical protein